MARIAMISLYDRNAYGMRLMSANLKKHGHHCDIIFLKRYDTNPTYQLDLEVGEYPWMGIAKSGRTFKYASNSRISDKELELLRELVETQKPDVIGMTVNTPLRVQAVKVTRFLKEHFDIPVLWGGYDPTVNAMDCLQLCDYACVGEGDQTILDIAACIDDGKPFDEVRNLAYRNADGKTVMNPKHPVERVLDNYPWRDNSPQDKYFIEDDMLVRDYPVLTDKPPGIYQAMSARGCPYRCSYCCEATLKDLYTGEVFLRRRSPEDMIAELEEYKRRFGLTRVQFEDEIFAMNAKWLEKFVPLYKERIGVPFTAYIYPSRNIEKILTLLKEAGLDYACLALESGSERINKKVFDRVYDRELFLFTAELCKRLGIVFYTDIITYNPYEEEEDLEKTLDVLLDLGGGYEMCVNKLFALPGTRFAEQMKRDGLQVGASPKDSMFDYYCRLFWMTSYRRGARAAVNFVRSVPLFRRHPWLVNPVLVEWFVSPESAARSFLKTHLPKRVVESLRDWRNARRDRRSAAKLAAATPVCR